MHDLELNRISASAIPAALDRARQYRSLLEPEQAESICLDILAVEPDHHEAQRVLILALTDQFSHSGQMLDAKRVLVLVDALPEEYERLYYRGLISERRGRAMLNESMSRSFTYEYFREAMQCYARAQELRPDHNDDAILRWNACLRTIRRQRLEPRADRDERHLDMEC
jgi:tetratricopeptide (TPR) repeat protein